MVRQKDGSGLAAQSARRADRMLSVLRMVNERETVTLADLAAELKVSLATMRRDLAEMDDDGLLIRTHGGARAQASHGELPVRLRDLQAKDAKHRIAVYAAEMVASGQDAIALSGGTTTTEIARALSRRSRLTIVTNALTIATELAARPTAKVILIGGIIRPNSFEAVGSLAESSFRVVRIGTAIIGVDGISAHGGATTHDEIEGRTNHVMIQQAERVMVVADGSKIGKVTQARMAEISEIDVLITDTDADADEITRLRAAGVTVHQVDLRR